jgi:hypothetical protein
VRFRRTTISGARAVFLLLILAALAGPSVSPARAGDPYALSPIWAVRIDSPPAARPVADDVHVYVALRAGWLLAVSRHHGREAWRVAVPPAHGLSAGDDRVFVVTDEAIVALDARTGAPAWRVTTAAAAVAPTWRSGWLLAGTTTGEIVALRAADGAVVWQRALGSPLRHPVTIDGDRVYAALEDGSVTAIDITTGAVRWHIGLAGPPGPPLGAGDRVYVGADDNFFYALDAASGRRRWRWRSGGDIAGLPALDAERVYFVSLDNNARALDARSGVQHWRRPLESRPQAGPLLLDGLLLIGGLGAELRMLRLSDGGTAATWTAPAELTQPPLLLPEGGSPSLIRLVIVTGAATGDWRIYGLGPAVEPAPGPLKEIPGLPLSPDAPPALPEPPPPGGPLLP